MKSCFPILRGCHVTVRIARSCVERAVSNEQQAATSLREDCIVRRAEKEKVADMFRTTGA